MAVAPHQVNLLVLHSPLAVPAAHCHQCHHSGSPAEAAELPPRCKPVVRAQILLLPTHTTPHCSADTVAAYRYFSTLPSSDSNYIPRPDGTSPPNLVALTNGEVEQRPGSKEDKALYQVCRSVAAVCNAL